MNYEHYAQLAVLFDFPPRASLRTSACGAGSDYIVHGRELLEVLHENYPDAANQLQYFLDGFPQKTLDQQELYTRTFDVQAITTLDIGYVLFGDDYKRAELLSNLAREHKHVGNDCGIELADNLPNVLRLMPQLSDLELVGELVGEILVPALMLMIREFDSERIEKKNTNYQKHYKTLIELVPGSELTIYCWALKALLGVLLKDFPLSDRVEKFADWSNKQSADFLGSIIKEMEIENNASPTNSGCDS